MLKLTKPMSLSSVVTHFCISSRRKEHNGQKSARAVVKFARLVENDMLLPSMREALLVYFL